MQYRPLKRIENDFYPTPDNLTEVLLRHQPNISGLILEPCSGENAIVNVLKKNNYSVIATDINNGVQYDATKDEYWENIDPVDWIITNPPFNQAPSILERSLIHANKGVAMLLRITFLEPCKNRRTLLRSYSDCMVQIIPINPRVKFRKDTKQTDSTTVAWYVWRKNFSWKNLGHRTPFIFSV